MACVRMSGAILCDFFIHCIEKLLSNNDDDDDDDVKLNAHHDWKPFVSNSFVQQCHRVIRLPLFIFTITELLLWGNSCILKKWMREGAGKLFYVFFHSVCTLESRIGCLMMTLSIFVVKEDASHLFSLSLTRFCAI